MLKILMVAMISAMALQSNAQNTQNLNSDDQVAQAFCSVTAENYARGEVSGLYTSTNDRVHVEQTHSEFFKTSHNEYFVQVNVTVMEDFLTRDVSPLYYACYRCGNGRLRVTQENYDTACEDMQ